MDSAEKGHKAFQTDSSTTSAHAKHRRWSLLAILFTFLLVSGGYFYYTSQDRMVVLKVGAGPYRSDSYELMKEVSDVVDRHSKTLKVEVEATRDSSDNISLLNAGSVDLATIRSDTPVASNVRQIANLFQDYFQIITRSDRPIFRVVDLVGKKVAIPRFGTDEFRSFWVIGDHYDLPIREVKWLSINFEEANTKLLSGEVDAIFTVRSLRDPRLLNLFEDATLKELSLRIIAIDQAEAITIKRPFLQANIIPKGAFIGKSATPSRDLTTNTVDRVLVVRDNIDIEAVRELTRILYEHRSDLTIRFSLASAITKPDEEAGLSTPLHEGAAQYFNRDEPSFIQENAEPLALLVTVTAMLISGLFALRSRFIASQKNRMDSYNYRLLEIAEAAHSASSTSELRGLKAELSTVLEEVVYALDRDEVTDEGFQSFSLLLESVREVLRDRRLDIQEAKSKRKNKSAKRA